MKNSLRKIAAGVSAAAMLVSAMPIVGAFAAEKDNFKTRKVEGGVVITEYVGENLDKIVIPSTIDDQDVVGVDNYAFSLVSKDVTFVVPETLTLANIGNEAFMTAGAFNTNVISVTGAKTFREAVTYWTDLLHLDITDAIITRAKSSINMNIDMDIDDAIAGAVTGAEIEAAVKKEVEQAVLKAVVIAVSEQVDKYASYLDQIELKNSITETVIGFVEGVQNGEFEISQKNIDRLTIALAALPYDGVTLEGPAGTDAQTYAAGKVRLTYNEVEPKKFLAGDANLNGGLDLQDVIAISKHLLKKPELTGDNLLAADYTGNKIVDLQDCIGVAKELLK